MIASKIVPGDYAVDVPAALTNVEALEYYIEAWDMAGNGPPASDPRNSPSSSAWRRRRRSRSLGADNVTIKPKGAPRRSPTPR